MASARKRIVKLNKRREKKGEFKRENFSFVVHSSDTGHAETGEPECEKMNAQRCMQCNISYDDRKLSYGLYCTSKTNFVLNHNA